MRREVGVLVLGLSIVGLVGIWSGHGARSMEVSDVKTSLRVSETNIWSIDAGFDGDSDWYDVGEDEGVYSDEPEQVSLEIVQENKDGWGYVIRYATGSHAKPQNTVCHAKLVQCFDSEHAQGSVIEGHGESSTYSNFLHANSTYTNTGEYYTSPYLHRCKLPSLKPNCEYKYSVGERNGEPEFRKDSFLTPPLPGTTSSFKFAVTADVGQTKYSVATMTGVASWLKKEKSSTIVFPGDLSYADGYQPRWDSFGRRAEVMLGVAETIFAAGNHEIEHQEAFVAYQYRYTRPLWHAQRRGPVHFITLCTYCDFREGGPQFRWFEYELKHNVNRKETPWLIVQMHAPFYCSSKAHYKELEEMRRVFEPLMLTAKVDFCFTGHVHAFERMHPIPDECGIVHLVVGDGGNREKASTMWIEPKPSWSAKREAAFGFGTVRIIDENVATWAWYRNSGDDFDYPDQIPPHDAFKVDHFVYNRSKCRP